MAEALFPVRETKQARFKPNVERGGECEGVGERQEEPGESCVDKAV